MSDGFSLMAQVETPRSLSMEPFLANISQLGSKVNSLILSEGLGGLSSLVLACRLQDQGVEPIVHIICRDKNRLALFSDLATLAASGLTKVVISAGDHPMNSAVPSTKAVYDLDVIQVLQLVRAMGQGVDVAGEALAGSKSFSVGVMGNPNGNMDMEMRSLRTKVETAASFIVLTPSTDLAKTGEITGALQVPVIASVRFDGASAEHMAQTVASLKNVGAAGLNLVVPPGQEAAAGESLGRLAQATA